MNDLREEINDLTEIALALEPGADTREQWMGAVHDYAENFLDRLDAERTYIQSKEMGAGVYDTPIGEEGKPMDALLEVLAEHVDRPGLNPASGGHLAYIPGGGLYPTALGDFLADVTNRYAGVFFGGPGAVRMENMLIRWMCRIVGFPDTALGNLTSGGSIANLTAVATARDVKGITSDRIRQSVIYLTHQAHHSVQKAFRIAGLGEAVLRYIQTDDHFRMDMDHLRKTIEDDRASDLHPFLLIGSAGTTDTGAVDRLDQMADLAAEHDLWFHVDAAYGGFFILSEQLKPKFKGMERADSITIDPHKGLFLAYGTGALLIKDVNALHQTHRYRANYMQDTLEANEEFSPAELSPELTKHFRGLRMWMPLQLFGVRPFRAALLEKRRLCQYFYGEIAKLGFETGPAPELSVCIYRYVPETGDANAFNARLIEAVHRDGRVFLSSTNIDGIYWLRLAVLCFRTHLSTIDLCLQMLAEKVAEVKGQAGVTRMGTNNS